MCLAHLDSDPVVEPRTPLSYWSASSVSCSSPVLRSVMVARIRNEMVSEPVPNSVPDLEYSHI